MKNFAKVIGLGVVMLLLTAAPAAAQGNAGSAISFSGAFGAGLVTLGAALEIGRLAANAVALGSIPWQAGRMVGPSITGILIAAFGGTVGLAIAVVSSGMALAMYSRLRVDTKAGAPGGHMGTQLVEGLSFVRHNFVFAALSGFVVWGRLRKAPIASR